MMIVVPIDPRAKNKHQQPGLLPEDIPNPVILILKALRFFGLFLHQGHPFLNSANKSDSTAPMARRAQKINRGFPSSDIVKT